MYVGFVHGVYMRVCCLVFFVNVKSLLLIYVLEQLRVVIVVERAFVCLFSKLRVWCRSFAGLDWCRWLGMYAHGINLRLYVFVNGAIYQLQRSC